MRKKEMIAMLLAGGQGSRLGILTKNLAKPAVAFGGKYRLIDFPLSNCINSGVDTVGVLTQYQPLALNQHIGIGTSWDLDRESGGVTVLAPRVKNGEYGEWYSGSANAIFQNVDFIDRFNPEYVLVLSGDHIYKMDYSKMLDFHKEKKCDLTIAVLEVSLDEATRLGIMNAEADGRIFEFEEKPKNPKSNLASMGIYIFSWKVLRKALLEDNKIHNDSDFGKHIIPSLLSNDSVLYAYRFADYWKDVGTIESYWQANMELIKTLPDFNLYDDFWKIYTNSDHQPPIYASVDADVKTSMAAEGCEIYGKVYNSVLGPGVVVHKNAKVQDSIILENTIIGEDCELFRAIVAENCVIGKNVTIGAGENTPNIDKPNIYDTGITVIGDNSIVPDNVKIGKNCIVYGETSIDMYENGVLESGHSLVKEDEAE